MKVFIAKPSLLNQASLLLVFDAVSDLVSLLEEYPEVREWVVQRYIHPPLLIRGRKFHIRTYVLCTGDLDVYVWKDMLLLFASTTLAV